MWHWLYIFILFFMMSVCASAHSADDVISNDSRERNTADFFNNQSQSHQADICDTSGLYRLCNSCPGRLLSVNNGHVTSYFKHRPSLLFGKSRGLRNCSNSSTFFSTPMFSMSVIDYYVYSFRHLLC